MKEYLLAIVDLVLSKADLPLNMNCVMCLAVNTSFTAPENTG